MDELKKSFRPEFLNRIDDIIVFHQLEEKDIEKIVKLMLKSVTDRLEEQDIFLTFTDKAEKYLCSEGYDQEYGARPLRRTITKKVEDMLSEEILLGNVVKGNAIIIAEENDKLVINKK